MAAMTGDAVCERRRTSVLPPRLWRLRHARCVTLAATAVASLSLARGSDVALLPLPFEYSKDFDLWNQGEAVKYFEERFYREGRGVLTDEHLNEVDSLRRRALEDPVLALAAAQALYMFGWFRSTGELLRGNVAAAAQLFERSIAASNCVADGAEWVDNACDIRWTHASLLYHWLGETDHNSDQGRSYMTKAYEVFRGLMAMPRYKDVRDSWTTPLHINFNALRFPGRPSRPVWPTDSLPIGKFLEEHHHIFKAELEAIVNHPGDLYTQLMRADGSREHLSSPGGWDTIRIVRYHHWYDLFCQVAPQTCELVASRPEIINCTYMNVNYVKLHPGAHLKPHYGNGPRLSAHLSVIAPEPLRAGMTVGNDRVLWLEGKAILFDDTYPHSVSHWGKLPRYVMLVWFCHPCDETNPHQQTCSDS